VDGADATTAAVAVGYLDAMADRATLALRQAVLARGGPAVGAAAAIPSVITQPRIWFNPDLESSHFLIPGLIAMLLMLAAVIATSLSIVREKERRTIDQIMVSPLRPAELILGKILPYVVICLVTLALVLALGRVLFGVRIQGSHALLALTTLLFLFAALGLGLLISAMTRSQQVAFQMAILTSLLPSLILSGLIFPIRNMPLPIQGVSLLVIPRYFVAALRGVILKGATLADLWPDLGALLLFGLVFNGLAGRRIRKAV
jgi:ABC-2 type transport system permease protein